MVRGGSKRPRSEFLRLVPTLVVDPVNSREAIEPVSQAKSFCRVEATHRFLVTMDSAAQASFFLFNSTLAGVFACSKRSNTVKGWPSGHFAIRDQQLSSEGFDHVCHCHPTQATPATARTSELRNKPCRQFRRMRLLDRFVPSPQFRAEIILMRLMKPITEDFKTV